MVIAEPGRLVQALPAAIQHLRSRFDRGALVFVEHFGVQAGIGECISRFKGFMGPLERSWARCVLVRTMPCSLRVRCKCTSVYDVFAKNAPDHVRFIFSRCFGCLAPLSIIHPNNLVGCRNFSRWHQMLSNVGRRAWKCTSPQSSVASQTCSSPLISTGIYIYHVQGWGGGGRSWASPVKLMASYSGVASASLCFAPVSRGLFALAQSRFLVSFNTLVFLWSVIRQMAAATASANVAIRVKCMLDTSRRAG